MTLPTVSLLRRRVSVAFLPTSEHSPRTDEPIANTAQSRPTQPPSQVHAPVYLSSAFCSLGRSLNGFAKLQSADSHRLAKSMLVVVAESMLVVVAKSMPAPLTSWLEILNSTDGCGKKYAGFPYFSPQNINLS